MWNYSGRLQVLIIELLAVKHNNITYLQEQKFNLWQSYIHILPVFWYESKSLIKEREFFVIEYYSCYMCEYVITIMQFYCTRYKKAVREPRVSPDFAVNKTWNYKKMSHTSFWPLQSSYAWPYPPMHHRGSLPPSLIKIDGRLYKWAAILQTLNKMSHTTLWPLDDLWPIPTMHHPCSYTQGSLPPSLIKIDGRLYKWAAILQTLTKMSHTVHVHVHVYTYCTYIYIRTYRNS